ncbi:hypothetical protein HO133_002050 [Letharia lupina]|uniref:Kinetochore protein mis13 n=1 Tax=Letharia lupina TaxID=560253 RepID=A0A8H6FAG1_9LECA|nr:uncharacterized protein HO133_002050 [Letharia lupina]KAF6221195.1 hypothetical protein HO133_002050 [Letharia lupina]
MMSEPSRGGRRRSSRLEDKEDAPFANGIVHDSEPVKGRQSTTVKQGKASVNGAGVKSAAKRQLAWDEEADGFAFTRTRAKKAKAEAVLASTAEEPRQEEQAEPAPTRKSKKKATGSPSAAPVENGGETARRRSTRHSGEHENADPPALPVKKRRKDRASSELKPDHGGERSHMDNERARKDPQQNHTQPIEVTFDATKIALPFADTPIIRRNKEMRKTNATRRSSLGMRGRRASSLIDTGKSNAMPHDEVESSEFYKHIASDGLSEPRRMKQLLTWCATRALGEKPLFSTEDGNARLAAREIQSQLLKDFSTKSEMSDWFSRNDSTPEPSLPRPNPMNVSNLAKIQDLEQQIARLQTERQTWESLLRPPPDSAVLLPPLPLDPPAQLAIDSNLLSDPAQTAALETLQSLTSDFQPSLSAITSSRLQAINQNLEFDVDKFAHNVHALGAYKDAAERIADEVLGLSAEALEKRDREGKARAAGEGGEPGMRDVLRGLSRVVDR